MRGPEKFPKTKNQAPIADTAAPAIKVRRVVLLGQGTRHRNAKASGVQSM